MPDFKKLSTFAKKQKYLIIILLFGIALMMLPSGESKNDEGSVKERLNFSVEETERKLKRMLESCEGVGRVEVALSVRGGVEAVYAEKEKISIKENETDSDRQLSVISEGSGKDSAVIIKELYPEYLGAAVVCDGADNPEVSLNIISAVSSLTGITSERITVAKMKN